MLANKELLESLLDYIGKKLKHETEGLLIGGNAMIFYGLREQTKDMDIVLFDKKDIAAITQIVKTHPLFKKSKIVKKLPYEVKPELLKKGEPTIIQDTDIPRFDLFYRYVFSIDVSDIFNECKRSVRFDLLKLKLVQPEHLIFLKGVTGRPIDQDDIGRIINALEIEWKHFLEFVKKYYKKDKKVVWLLLDNLYEINEKQSKKKIIPEFVLEEIAKLFNVKV